MYSFGTDEHDIFETHKRYRNYTLNEMHLSRKNDPATSAVITASSVDIVKMILDNMRSSVWWNHEARFFIVNTNFYNGCDQANLFLNTIWAHNVLSVIYLCYGRYNQPILHTFNPYTNLAPQFWNEIEDDQFLNEYWTPFEHPLESLQPFETLVDQSKYMSLLRYFKLIFNL